MPKRRLTQDLVDALEPDGSVREFRDTQLRGFGVRIMPSGRKSWFLHAQHDKRRKWMKLGEAATMRLAKARTLARARLATLRNRNPSRPPDASAEIPFEDVAEAAFRRHARFWKPGTMEVNRYYLKNQILPHFAGRPVAAITHDDVQKWFASLRPTPASADRSLPVLSVIMQEAERLGYRPEDSNPCRNVKRHRRRGRDRFLSREEARRLGRALANRDGHILAAAVRLLILTGCRKSEIMTLKWRDIRDGRLFLRDSKTGPRVVWLSSAAQEILDGLPRRRVWIFPGRKRNRPLSAQGLNSFWRDLRDEAGLKDLRLHDLRHTYATLALQAGETVPTIGRLLGHSDPNTTLKYVHLADETVRESVDTVEQVLGGEPRP